MQKVIAKSLFFLVFCLLADTTKPLKAQQVLDDIDALGHPFWGIGGQDSNGLPNPFDLADDQHGGTGAEICPCGPPVHNAMKREKSRAVIETFVTEFHFQWSYWYMRYVQVPVRVKKRCYLITYDCLYVRMGVGPCCACSEMKC